MSVPTLDSLENLCPEDVPAVVVADDDVGEGLEESSSSSAVVEFSPNASAVPGIIQVSRDVLPK